MASERFTLDTVAETTTPDVLHLFDRAGDSASQIAVGMQLAQSVTSPVVESLKEQNQDLRSRLSEAQDQIREDRENHRDELTRIRQETADKLDTERRRADVAERALEMANLRAELKGTQDQTPIERMVAPLVGSLPALLAQMQGTAPAPSAAPPLATEALHPNPAPVAADAPMQAVAVPEAAPQTDPPDVIRARFEHAAVNALARAIQTGTSASGPVGTMIQKLTAAGLAPGPDALARIAIGFAERQAGLGTPAAAVADALRPVVYAVDGVQSLISAMKPEAAVPLLANLAGVPVEHGAYVADVIRVLTAPDSPEADSTAPPSA